MSTLTPKLIIIKIPMLVIPPSFKCAKDDFSLTIISLLPGQSLINEYNGNLHWYAFHMRMYSSGECTVL